MPENIMSVAEWKGATKHWSQIRKWGHNNLRHIDGALGRYHAIPRQNLEGRIDGLKTLMRIAYDYAEDKKLFVWQDTRRKRKISAAESLYNQCEAKVRYLEEVLKVEERLPAMFGVGRRTPIQQATTAKGKWLAAIRQVQGLQEYIGTQGDNGKLLSDHYWTEAIDPLHRNWGHPCNSPVMQEWVKQRHTDGTTELSFYRWFETLTDEQVLTITGGSKLLETAYQDEVGREQYRVHVLDGRLKSLSDSPDEMSLWSSERYKTNFNGNGWAIFVMSKDGRLYANNHDDTRGWFHAAFLGGKPVIAAGELYARNGVLYIMTDKSGHYKPQFTNLVSGARELGLQGLDISKLQLWSRWVDPGTGKIFTGQDGMRKGGIWYQSIDAQEYVRSGNRARALLFDFGIKSGSFGWKGTYSPESEQVFIEERHYLDKALLRGYSIDQYAP